MPILRWLLSKNKCWHIAVYNGVIQSMYDLRIFHMKWFCALIYTVKVQWIKQQKDILEFTVLTADTKYLIICLLLLFYLVTISFHWIYDSARISGSVIHFIINIICISVLVLMVYFTFCNRFLPKIFFNLLMVVFVPHITQVWFISSSMFPWRGLSAFCILAHYIYRLLLLYFCYQVYCDTASPHTLNSRHYFSSCIIVTQPLLIH